MNRHERRKAAKVMIGEQRTMTVEEFRSLPCCCIWHGCEKTYQGKMPHGWTALWLFRNPQEFVTDFYNEIDHGRNLIRDTSLCPEHTEELNSFFKSIGRPEMSEPVAGSA